MMIPAGIEAAIAAHLPDTIELWRDSDATPSAPTANRGRFGDQINSNAPAPAAQTGARKVDEAKGQLAPSPTKKGKPFEAQTQTVPISQWIISLLASKVCEWDIAKDDVLKTKGRAFKVVDKGGEDSFSPLRLIYCEEIG
jgi:hypothetical protein